MDHPKARESEEANRRSEAQRAKDFTDELRHELRHVLGIFREANRGVAKASHRQRDQQGHQPHRASHTTFVSLKLGDAFLQFVTLVGVVIKNALPQKRCFSFVFGHNCCRTINPASATETISLAQAGSPATKAFLRLFSSEVSSPCWFYLVH